MKREGIGAVVSNLKAVLYLANETGASVTGHNVRSQHGYRIREFVNLGKPLHNRTECEIKGDMNLILRQISEECETFDFGSLAEIGFFKNCNTVVIPALEPIHPRTCIKKTMPFVHQFLRLELNFSTDISEYKDICVARRGGDMEKRIKSGGAQQSAIDEKYTLPILSHLKEKGSRIVLVTQTTNEEEVIQKYQPDIFSNNEDLHVTFQRLSRCRCLFISSGTSFALFLVYITNPHYIVYTESAPDFRFLYPAYEYKEFGNRAISVRSNNETLLKRCFSQTN